MNRVFGNSVLGVMLAHFKLKLTDKALFYRARIKNEDYLIFLTDDEKRVASLLDIDINTLNELKSKEEMLEFFANLEKIKLPLYERFIDGHGGELLRDFAIFIKGIEYSDDYKRTSSYDIIEHFSDVQLKDKLLMVREIKNGNFTRKDYINGKNFLENIEGFDKLKIGESIRAFYESFTYKSDVDWYLFTHTHNEFLEKFKEISDTVKVV